MVLVGVHAMKNKRRKKPDSRIILLILCNPENNKIAGVSDYLAAVRIAVNTRFLLSEQLEGIGRFTFQLLKRLVELRPNDQFLFCFDRPFDSKFIFADNVEGRVVSPPARHPLLWYAWFEWAIPKALKNWRADIFVSMDGYSSLRSSVPDLLVIHDLAYFHFPKQAPWLVRKYLHHFVPRFAQKAQTLATVSEFSKQDLYDQLDLGQKEITVIPNGAPTAWSPLTASEKEDVRMEWCDGNNFFCALGAIHPRKNILGIIKGFDAFKAKNKSTERLIIIGRMAWQTAEVSNALAQSPYRKEIQLVGYQSDEIVHQLLGASEALLFLSLFEGFGVPMIEAMQLGVPLVYSDRSVIPEVAQGAGESTDPLNPAQVAGAMQKAIDPKNAEKYAAGAQRQLAKYNWDHSAELLNQLITRMTT